MTIARILIAIGAAIVLAAVDFSIVAKEGIKRDGEIIFLDLAPVDPRSLMQGDYMVLRFRLAQEIQASWGKSDANATPREGEIRHASIAVDNRRVASLAKAEAATNRSIRYRVRNGSVWLGTNAFFFEEGSDKRFASARYGEFRLDPASGEAVLVGLRDQKLNAL
jgi:uncharacterized membrane-anchored protein